MVMSTQVTPIVMSTEDTPAVVVTTGGEMRTCESVQDIWNRETLRRKTERVVTRESSGDVSNINAKLRSGVRKGNGEASNVNTKVSSDGRKINTGGDAGEVKRTAALSVYGAAGVVSRSAGAAVMVAAVRSLRADEVC
jgi:hypothetical protein